jgi:hypothetical protein
MFDMVTGYDLFLVRLENGKGFVALHDNPPYSNELSS